MWVLVGWILGHTIVGNIATLPLLVFSFVIAVVCFFKFKPLFKFALFLCAIFLGQYHVNSVFTEKLAQTEKSEKFTRVLVYIDKIDEIHLNSIQQTIRIVDRNVEWQAILNKKIFEKNPLQLGHYYYLEGNIKPTHSYAVPGAFNQEKWFLQQDLMATLMVKKVEDAYVQQPQFSKIKLWIEQKRLFYRQIIENGHFSHQGLILALLTGDESLLDTKTQSQFQQLGISHLLAISGPHVLVFALLMTLLIHWTICRVCPRVYDQIAKPYLLAIPFFGCVLFYCAFVGFEIPALRTLITTALITFTVCLKKKISPSLIIVSSAAILLIFAPLSMMSVAFWLSYGSCFILLRVYQTIGSICATTWQQKLILTINQFVQTQGKIFIALMPMTILFFGQISWIAPISNLIAIPLIGIVIVPILVFSAVLSFLSPLLGIPFFTLVNSILDLLIYLLSFLDYFAVLKYVWLTPIQIACLSLGIFILFLPKGVVPKSWALICCLAIFLPQKQPNFKLDILDVGQGQSIFIRHPEQNLLVDTGGTYNEKQFSLAQHVLIPYFINQGVNHLDRVVLSHLDQDHSGAFSRLEQLMDIKQVQSNELLETKNSFNFCHAGLHQQNKDLTIDILWPLSNEQDFSHPNMNRNDYSCVVYVSYQNKHFLIMADNGDLAEQYLIKNHPNLAVDVLILGHHGSKYSSSAEFLKAIHPKVAIASAGKNNLHGHPSIEVKERLQQQNIPLLTTADQGTITFTIENGQLNYL